MFKMRLVGQSSFSGTPLSFPIVKVLVSQVFIGRFPKIFSLSLKSLLSVPHPSINL
jgi:hypothetical protein